MSVEDNNNAIKEEVERLGRMTQAQEEKLYNIALRQDEQMGRQPTNMLLSLLEADSDLLALVDRELLTYEVFNKNHAKNQVACLFVTLKGIRYCNMFSDDIVANRSIDIVGHRRENK